MNADATLSLIDHALRDWETSVDAMRWAPDAKPDEYVPFRQEWRGEFTAEDMQDLGQIIELLRARTR